MDKRSLFLDVKFEDTSEAGSCNACHDRSGLVLVIEFHSIAIRVCQSCATVLGAMLSVCDWERAGLVQGFADAAKAVARDQGHDDWRKVIADIRTERWGSENAS